MDVYVSACVCVWLAVDRDEASFAQMKGLSRESLIYYVTSHSLWRFSLVRELPSTPHAIHVFSGFFAVSNCHALSSHRVTNG